MNISLLLFLFGDLSKNTHLSDWLHLQQTLHTGVLGSITQT